MRVGLWLWVGLVEGCLRRGRGEEKEKVWRIHTYILQDYFSEVW